MKQDWAEAEEKVNKRRVRTKRKRAFMPVERLGKRLVKIIK